MKFFLRIMFLLVIACSVGIGVCGCGDIERTINKLLTSTDDVESKALEMVRNHLRDVTSKNTKLKVVTADKLQLFKRGDAYDGWLHLTGPEGQKVNVNIKVEFDGRYIQCYWEELNKKLDEWE